ncbi:MAG: PulJ/GspJ family protein [Planctomycetota bacterium]
MRRTARVRGFTLVEVLLAAAIASIILVETAAIFRTATASHRRLTDTTLATAALHDALDLIARDVQRLIAPVDPSAPPLTAAADGTETTVLRLRLAPPPAVVDYFLYEDGPARLLVRRRERIRDGIGDADIEPVAWEVVARDVASFEARRFDGSTWTGAGAAAGEAPPRLVEVTLGRRRGDGEVVTASRIITVPVGEPPAGVAP